MQNTHAYINQNNVSHLNYVRASMAEPMLERDEESDLATKWANNNDEKALHKLIQTHSRLAISLASKFKYYGLPMNDLVQEGNIGLLEAAKRFDPKRDIRFSTYASWWIRATIQDYILRNWSIVRTGTTAAQKSLFFNFKRLKTLIAEGEDNLSHEHREKIATKLNVKVSDVEKMEGRLQGGDQSLNVTFGDDSQAEFQDFLEDERYSPSINVEKIHDMKQRNEWLSNAVKELDEREKIIIRKRCLAYNGATLETLGDELGVSKERIRQLEARAMKKLRTYFDTHDIKGSDIFQ